MEYRIVLSGTVTKEYIEEVAKDWLLVDPLRFLRQPGVSTNNGFGAGSRVGFDDTFQRSGYSAFPHFGQPTPPVWGQAPPRSTFGPPVPTHPVGPANNHLSGQAQCNVGEFHIAPQIRLYQLSEMGNRQVHSFVLNDREVLVVQQAGMHHQWVRLRHNWESPHTLQAAQAVGGPVVKTEWDRLWAAIKSGIRQLPAEAIASVSELAEKLFTWQGFLLIVAVTALFILGGEVALLLMGAVAVYDLLMNVLPLLVQFYHAAIAATTPEQTEAAGKIFAQALLNGAMDVVAIYFAVGAFNRLRVLGGGKITFRAVIVYLVERSQMLMARMAQGAGKLKQLIQEAEEAVRKQKVIPVLKRDFAEIEIVDAAGSPVGEFDGIDMGSRTFIEDKSAMGIGQINPRTGQPFQTAEQWATKQVYTKSINRIENLKRAAATRATKAGSPIAPSLSDIKDFKNLHFVIDSKDPAVVRAVTDQLSNLKKQYPGWNFTANFGK